MGGVEQEKGKTTTVRSSGCGLCSAIMVADRLLPNCEFGLKEAIDLAYATNANLEVGTTYQVYAPALAEKLGHQSKVIHREGEPNVVQPLVVAYRSIAEDNPQQP